MIEQGTDEWRRQRCGKVTASRMADVTARIKNGYGASRERYMADLIVERLTGLPIEGYINEAMRIGTQREPDARAAYEYLRECRVELAGFVPHPTIADSGASPDGFVGADGLLEIKCPMTQTHIRLLIEEVIPNEHEKQMQFQMACTGRQWCDYVSYDPTVPFTMRIFIIRVERDEKLIEYLNGEADKFLHELAGKVDLLRKKFNE